MLLPVNPFALSTLFVCLFVCSLTRAAVVKVDLTQSHPISPLIYGTNFATSNLLSWDSALNRNGGNSMSNWNWLLDATNSGNDWYFLSNPSSNSYPNGSTNDLQMDATFAAHSTFLTTISTIGWVTQTRQKAWSFSVAYYGAQQSTECVGDGNAAYCAADAGNGVLTNGNELYNNLTNYKASKPADAVAFVAHMRQRATPAVFDANTILQLDNEPDIWDSTHRDCHPAALTYAELWNYTLAYSSALKAAYPKVKIAGPIWCCWCAYFWSAKDGCGNGADYAAHGNTYITPWLLQQLNSYYLTHGVQLIDYIDIHYYPNVPTDESTQANQKQFTDQVRSFYDPTYPDPGWIGATGCSTGCNGPYVWLIPRFQQWIAQYAPNLSIQLAISEYSFSTNSDSLWSSTLANAEVMAVMGVQKVAYASRWESPAAGSVAENAYKLYLNYDGNKSRVMGSSVSTVSSTAPLLTAYSVYNSTTQTMFVLLFNLDFSADNAVSVNISSAKLTGTASSVSASVWRMSLASPTLSSQNSVTVAVSGGGSHLTLSGYSVPARSATLLVMKGVSSAPTPAAISYLIATSSQSFASSPSATSSDSLNTPSISTPTSTSSSPPLPSSSYSVSTTSSSASITQSSSTTSYSTASVAATGSSGAVVLNTATTAGGQLTNSNGGSSIVSSVWALICLCVVLLVASV